MGIQSTQDITRDEAIDRIETVCGLILEQNYLGLENCSFEPDYDIQKFIDNWQIMNIPINITNIANWTNKMLEDVLDQPYFRKSMFDNYFVGRE